MRKEDKVIQIGNHVEPKGFSNPQRGRVYSTLGVSPTVNTCGGGDLQPKILQCASRGRSDGGRWVQRLEVGDGNTQNSLTSVSTDTMVIKLLKDKEMQDNETTLDGYSFDIRKLTVKEVFRLMDVDDRHIDTLIGARETMKNGKERQAISNSALYRLAGNSIVVNCMTLMFENLLYPDTEPTTGDQLKLF